MTLSETQCCQCSVQCLSDSIVRILHLASALHEGPLACRNCAYNIQSQMKSHMMVTPRFANEQDEAEFWATHDATEFLDQTEPVAVTFVDARPRKTQISLRLDPATIDKLKAVSRRKGVGYQTLIRIWVMERLSRELG